jgi:flagellin
MSNMVVRTNIFALNAHRNLKNVGADQNRASNRLSSGFRINSAADDAAGLAISESMRAQIRGLDQASRNAQDGQALIQTAEGGMQEIQNMVQRIRELTVQAANDTNTEDNRNEHIALEIRNLLLEINDMANRVEYNGMVLLNGDFSNGVTTGYGNGDFGQGGLHFQVGANENQLMWTSVRNMQLLTEGAATGGQAHQALTTPGSLGQAMHTFVQNWNTIFSEEGFNAAGGLVTAVPSVATQGFEFGGINNAGIPAGSTQAQALSALIESIESGIQFTSLARAELGAVSNRLEYTMRSLDISSENLSDAESRVRNADMAREMMAFTMANVLQQASVSMLAQANQLPNNLLQLLR